MRTTVNISDDVLVVVRAYAAEREIPLGQAISDLIHRGVESQPQFKTRNGWVVFDAAPETPSITSELVQAWETADIDEEFRHALSPRR